MSTRTERVVHWFRSDLRLADNRGLAAAAARARELGLVFVLDERLLGRAAPEAPRPRFLLGSLERLAAAAAARGQRLWLLRGDPRREIPAFLERARVERVTWCRDPGPYAAARDAAVRRAATRLGVAVEEHKDRVVFEADELRTRTGDVYRVYSPFRAAWWARLRNDPQAPAGPLRLPPPFDAGGAGAAPAETGLSAASGPDAGDLATALPTPGEAAAARRLHAFLAGPLAAYAIDRDRPDVDGTSRLSPYLRFGALSIRVCVHAALERAREDPRARAGARKWIDELVWREFYTAILASYPHVLRQSFRPALDGLRWEEDEAGFRAWCAGRTGYPFVDAAMRQLAATGWMHNRARMVVASFLAKDLLVDWRRGERFFFERLVDGDPASNDGGWQWAVSTGTDAQPWFRIFSPVRQGERFDPAGRYVRRWVPELRDVDPRFVHRPWEASTPPRDYPRPMVDHAARRVLALRRYEAARVAARAAAKRSATSGAGGSGHRRRRSAHGDRGCHLEPS